MIGDQHAAVEIGVKKHCLSPISCSIKMRVITFFSKNSVEQFRAVTRPLILRLVGNPLDRYTMLITIVAHPLS